MIYDLLFRAASEALLDPFSVSRLARRVDDVARALLEDLSPDDPRHGLYCCAMFVLLLVDEGRLFDVQIRWCWSPCC